MFLVTPNTVLNSGVLDVVQLPRRFLGRATPWPRGQGWGVWARLVLEIEVLRYLTALIPFVIAGLIWPQNAGLFAQAPLLMLLLIWLVESRLLRVAPARRAALVSDEQADRGLDLLAARARTILTRIAAGRGLTDGALRLVIEQSDMVRVPPLTLVSVQSEDGPRVLALSDAEGDLIRETLFQPPLTERELQRIGLARKIEVHDLPFDPAQVSGHARLAALMAARAGQGAGVGRAAGA
jgi:hypothetical protein